MKWTEANIARTLARQIFKGHLCCLPNCTWTGDEIDLFVLAPCLRIIDVEIKISRADLKADKAKDKWWRHAGGWYPRGERPPPTPKPWPNKVWKHYYAMPAEIWRDDLLEHIQPVSGVILLREQVNGVPVAQCRKRAKPCSDAPRVDAAGVMQIARLASLRMWDAYKRDEQRRAETSLSGGNVP